MDNRLGYWMLGFVCCIEPLLGIVAGVLIHKRHQRGGLASFFHSRRQG